MTRDEAEELTVALVEMVHTMINKELRDRHLSQISEREGFIIASLLGIVIGRECAVREELSPTTRVTSVTSIPPGGKRD